MDIKKTMLDPLNTIAPHPTGNPDPASPPTPPLVPTQEQLHQNSKLPAQALFTSHQEVDTSTGAALEHGKVELTEGDKAWMAVIYKAVHPDTGLDAEYDKLVTSSKGRIWEGYCADEFGRLAQGNKDNDIEGTDTIHFIKQRDIPEGRKATYLKLVADDTPHKTVPGRIRGVVGGDRVEYPGKTATKGSDMVTFKCLLNSTISTRGARFMNLDIKNFYLGTHMGRFEYMKIKYSLIPDTIKEQYGLDKLVVYDKKGQGFIYVEIRKGMYGLPQAGRLANDKLVAHLAKHGYHQAPNTPGLFRHETRNITFVLVVDDFGVKYVGKENADHLINTLKELYTITENWKGDEFLGFTIRWNYDKRTVGISMPGYIKRALQRFGIKPPNRPQDAPHAWTKPVYGKHPQLPTAEDTSPLLDPKDLKRLEELVGTLLYYGRAIDSSTLVALGTIASSQVNGTQATKAAMQQLIDYLATHPYIEILYKASGMRLWIDSDASYLSEAKARSRVGGYYYLTTFPNRTPTAEDASPPSMELFISSAAS
jgi:hypothetical protein